MKYVHQILPTNHHAQDPLSLLHYLSLSHSPVSRELQPVTDAHGAAADDDQVSGRSGF